MTMILFGALSAGTKIYYVGQIDMLLHQHFATPWQLKFCFSFEIHSSIWPFTISFQDDETESSTISHLAHCNACWSTASNKSDKFLSQSTLHPSLYFGPFVIRSLNLECGMIGRPPVTAWPYG